jgi:hypothetical protein
MIGPSFFSSPHDSGNLEEDKEGRKGLRITGNSAIPSTNLSIDAVDRFNERFLN